MFNEELKRRFVKERNEEVILPDKYLERQFNKIAEMENDLNKDLFDFTAYEIIEYYKLLNTHSIGTLQVMNSQFSLYTQWCLQKNLVKDNQNHFLEITDEILKGCINKALFDEKVITRKEIVSLVDDIINPKDQFIILGLFEGIYGKEFCELIKLRPENINGNVANLCTGRKITLSNKLIEIIDDCIMEDKYYGSEDCEKGKQKVFRLIDTGYIIKDFPNVKSNVSDYQKGRRLYSSMKRSLSVIDKENIITAKDIINSGMLDMVRQRSTELGISNIEYITSNHIKEVEDKYDIRIFPAPFIRKYESYLV